MNHMFVHCRKLSSEKSIIQEIIEALQKTKTCMTKHYSKSHIKLTGTVECPECSLYWTRNRGSLTRHFIRYCLNKPNSNSPLDAPNRHQEKPQVGWVLETPFRVSEISPATSGLHQTLGRTKVTKPQSRAPSRVTSPSQRLLQHLSTQLQHPPEYHRPLTAPQPPNSDPFAPQPRFQTNDFNSTIPTTPLPRIFDSATFPASTTFDARNTSNNAHSSASVSSSFPFGDSTGYQGYHDPDSTLVQPIQAHSFSANDALYGLQQPPPYFDTSTYRAEAPVESRYPHRSPLVSRRGGGGRSFDTAQFPPSIPPAQSLPRSKESFDRNTDDHNEIRIHPFQHHPVVRQRSNSQTSGGLSPLPKNVLLSPSFFSRPLSPPSNHHENHPTTLPRNPSERSPPSGSYDDDGLPRLPSVCLLPLSIESEMFRSDGSARHPRTRSHRQH
ncbi:hypothetical protein JCM5350_005585 [Sporobolomyces pararoseus]